MKILQLNMHRAKVADALLPQIMLEESATVAIICEQYSRKSGIWVEEDSATAAIWIPAGENIPIRSSGKGNCFSWLQTDQTTLVSCYLTPSDNTQTFEEKLNNIEDFVRSIRGNIVVAGDFNARAAEWGMMTTDARGRKVVDMMARTGLVVANVGNIPTFRRPGCQGTIPDITLVSERTLRRIEDWRVLEIYTGSDHQYISYKLRINETREYDTRRQNTTTRKWRVSKLNMNILTTEIDHMTNEAPETLDASRTAETLIRNIQLSCDKAMPRICANRMKKKAVHWWSQDIAEARRECLQCRRRLTRARKRGEAESEKRAHKEAKKRLQEKIFRSKKALWESLREDLNSNPWGTGYKLVMGKLCPKSSISPMSESKATKIVRSLFPTHDGIEQNVTFAQNANIPLFTKDELAAAASKLKPGKTPGPDGIPSEVIMILAQRRPELLLNVFNKCLVEGTYPEIWKKQKLVLISKGKGDPDSPSAYRPLCMLDTLGKLLERLIKPRLAKAIEASGGLSDRQHGFRPGRSTIGALKDVVQAFEVAQRKNHFSRPLILLATLDVKNAFNSLRWKDVFQALESHFQVPIYLRRIIRSYLSNRRLVYDTSEGQRIISVTSGAAQGSILGPDLWNASYDSLLRMEMPHDTFLVGYADDIVAVISARNTTEAERKLKQVMIRTHAWMNLHGLTLATQKTELLLLTRRHIPIEISFNFGGTTLQSKRCINYLGVRLDPKMMFANQIQHATTKASKITSMFSRLMANVGGPTQEKRRLLMETSNNILLYGCEV